MNPSSETAAPTKLARGVRVASAEELTISRQEVIGFFLSRVTADKKSFLRLGALLLLQAAVVGGGIWLVKIAVDQYFADRTTALLIFALFLATVGKSLVDFLYSWSQNLTVARVRDTLVADAYHDLLYCSFSVHLKERNSRKYGWILEDTNNFIESSFGVLQVWVKQPIQIVSSIVALAIIDWQLTALGLLIAPIGVPFLQYFRRKSAKFVAQRKLLLGQLEERIAETIYGIRIVKAFDLEQREFERVKAIIERQRQLHQTSAFYIGLSGPVSEALGLLGLTLVLLFGTQSIFSGSFTAGTLLAFLMAFLGIYRPFKDVSRGFLLQQLALDAGRRLMLLHRQSERWVVPSDATAIDRFELLEYRDVWFSYAQQGAGPSWVLQGINLRINRGETILLTGVSGAGKSTTCDLAFRLFRPQRGEILVNGVPLDRLQRDCHRRLFAMCSQETIIFNDTLLENIRVARPEAARDEVLEVARLVQLPNKMLERLDDPIGDRGTQLSGGERQRVALARAVLCRPDFLLLDEALNNLDPETEARIWKGLREYLPDSTMLVVSHRWLDLNQYDRLLVLANGQLIEDVQISNDRAAASTVLEKYRTAARSVVN